MLKYNPSDDIVKEARVIIDLYNKVPEIPKLPDNVRERFREFKRLKNAKNDHVKKHEDEDEDEDEDENEDEDE